VKVVLDTNVVVSGIFFGGMPGRIMHAWAKGQLSLVLSPAILGEYQRVGAELGAQHPDLTAVWEPALALASRRSRSSSGAVVARGCGEWRQASAVQRRRRVMR
jgi:hypothetical protein